MPPYSLKIDSSTTHGRNKSVLAISVILYSFVAQIPFIHTRPSFRYPQAAHLGLGGKRETRLQTLGTLSVNEMLSMRAVAFIVLTYHLESRSDGAREAEGRASFDVCRCDLPLRGLLTPRAGDPQTALGARDIRWAASGSSRLCRVAAPKRPPPLPPPLKPLCCLAWSFSSLNVGLERARHSYFWSLVTLNARALRGFDQPGLDQVDAPSLSGHLSAFRRLCSRKAGGCLVWRPRPRISQLPNTPTADQFL